MSEAASGRAAGFVVGRQLRGGRDRGDVGHALELGALLVQVELGRVVGQRPAEQAGGQDGGQHGQDDDPPSHPRSVRCRGRPVTRRAAPAGSRARAG